jgi:hypothetical protein
MLLTGPYQKNADSRFLLFTTKTKLSVTSTGPEIKTSHASLRTMLLLPLISSLLEKIYILNDQDTNDYMSYKGT